MNRRNLLALAGCTLLAPALPAWAARPRMRHGRAFGASWTLAAAFLDDLVVADIEAIVASVDEKMSPFRADSELCRFNRAATTGWQALSNETCGVVAEALRVAAITENAFNPTVGPLVARYGFGPIAGGEAGSPEEISVNGDAVRKARANLSLDLCGIAKGHALDRMVMACAARGMDDFLIELGGEVFARGRHPSGRSWRVGVEGPAGFQHALALDDAALATSGRAVNGFSHRGRRYAHIVDPATGRPADSALFSVTVAGRSAIAADALATALFAMGPERGPAFARRGDIEALFVMEDGAEAATGGFEARILDREAREWAR